MYPNDKHPITGVSSESVQFECYAIGHFSLDIPRLDTYFKIVIQAVCLEPNLQIVHKHAKKITLPMLSLLPNGFIQIASLSTEDKE